MASISNSSAAPGSRDIWEHRTPKGSEIGGEIPSGSPSVISDFGNALVTVWRVRKTIWLLVVYDYKSRYRAQSLGMFWSIAHPLLMMATLTVAFTLILKVPIPNFPVFYLSAGVLWHFFTNSVSSATNALTSGGTFVKTTNLPRYLLPIVATCSNFINLATELTLLFGMYFVYPTGFSLNITLLFYPFLLLLLVIFTIGVGFITASANVRFRDTGYIVSSVLMIGFWFTPILYDVSMAPAWIGNILRLNPLAGILEGARLIIMFGRMPALRNLVPSILATVLAFTIGSLIFRKENVTVADYV